MLLVKGLEPLSLVIPPQIQFLRDLPRFLESKPFHRIKNNTEERLFGCQFMQSKPLFGIQFDLFAGSRPQGHLQQDAQSIEQAVIA